jgi:hypothetical protein
MTIVSMNVLKPWPCIAAKSLSTARLHRRRDKTPPCEHPPATLAVKLLLIRKVWQVLIIIYLRTSLKLVYIFVLKTKASVAQLVK